MSNEGKQNLNSGGPWWKEGVKIMSDISTWIAVPVVLALFGGKALDTHFDTKPVIFLVCMGLGFTLSGYKIWKIVKNYADKATRSVEKK